MDRSAETTIAAEEKSPREKVLDLLRARNGQARFVTELYASLARLGIGTADADRALAELETAGAVMVRAHFCADPHLAGVDLRVVALVEGNEGEDPQAGAIHRIDEIWNRWLNEYLA
ncbi:MAG: hypothetical protein ACM3SP_17300, partial [Chloroflexota bacterium]